MADWVLLHATSAASLFACAGRASGAATLDPAAVPVDVAALGVRFQVVGAQYARALLPAFQP